MWSRSCKKKEKDEQGNVFLKCRGDSFVVKTNIHFPTDINLLFDAMRKELELTGQLFEKLGVSGWRQYRYNIKQIKQSYRKAQQSKRSKAKNAEEIVKKTHKDYIEVTESFLYQVILSLNVIGKEHCLSLIDAVKVEEINQYIVHAKRQINQINRRVLQDETIPHKEKIGRAHV